MIPNRKYPAFIFLVVMLIGMLFGHILRVSLLAAAIPGLILIVMGIVFYYRKRYSFVYFPIVIAVGLILSVRIDSEIVKPPVKLTGEFPAVVEGHITKVLNRKDNSLRCIVEGEIDGKYFYCMKNQRFILSIYKCDSSSAMFVPGSIIRANAKTRFPRRGNLPDEFDEFSYCRSQDISWICWAGMSEVSIIKPAAGTDYLFHSVRSDVRDFIVNHFDSSNAGIAYGVISGDRSMISRGDKNMFSFSGTAHLLAVSGLHVGIIAASFFFILGFVRNSILRLIIFALLIASFVLFSGMQPSAVRAGTAAVFIVMARTFNRRTDLLNILSFIIIIYIIIEPAIIFSIAFRMSASAVLGITILYKPIYEKLRKLMSTENQVLGYLIKSLSMTLSASIIVSPLVAIYFDVYSLISPVANLIVIPLMSLGIVYTFISAVLSWLFYPLASILASTADFFIMLSREVIQFAVSIPYSYITGSVSVPAAITFSAMIIILVFSTSMRQLLFRGLVSVSIVLVCCYIGYQESDPVLRIYPRGQYVAVEFKNSQSEKSIVISDRKPGQYPIRDIAMENYISSYSGKLTLGITGNAGQNIADNIELSENHKILYISLSDQEKIRKELGLSERLHRIIEYEH